MNVKDLSSMPRDNLQARLTREDEFRGSPSFFFFFFILIGIPRRIAALSFNYRPVNFLRAEEIRQQGNGTARPCQSDFCPLEKFR